MSRLKLSSRELRKLNQLALEGSGNSISVEFEVLSKGLDSTDKTYNYTNGVLTSIVYANGITKTLNYTSGRLTSVVLSGDVPSGINLTKNYNYTNGVLTSVTYE